MHRLGTVARQQCEVMRLARRTGLDHQAGGRAQALGDQVLVDGAVASSAGIATCSPSMLRSETISTL